MGTVGESELERLDEKQGLYLRQFWRVEIEVKLPQITVPGQSISNWDLMERLKKAVVPVKMEGIKVRESKLESVTFDAELFSKIHLGKVMRILDGMGVKVSGWAEPFRVTAKEANPECPTRIDWDKHFGRMIEHGKAGLRPDTVHLSKVPANWFNDGIVDGPCERLLRKAFEGFGNIRLVDIPICDPLRIHMPSDISGLPKKISSFGPEVLFDGYIQFVDYDGFSLAMDRLKNRKWVKRTEDGRQFTASVKVDFDRCGHLTDSKVVAREGVKDRLNAEQRRKVEEENEKRQEEERKKREEEEEKERRREEREMKRKLKHELERRRAEESKVLEIRLREEAERSQKERREQAERLLRIVMDRIQIKEERRIRIEEEKLKEELAMTDMREIDTKGETENSLRETLLRQQEMRMRDRLKEKLMAARKSRETDSDEDNKKKRKKKEKRMKKKKDKKSSRKDEPKKHKKKSSRRSRSSSTSSSD